MVFYSNVTGIELDDYADEVRILDDEGEVVDSISYYFGAPNVPLPEEDKSIGRYYDGNDLIVTFINKTPGEPNILGNETPPSVNYTLTLNLSKGWNLISIYLSLPSTPSSSPSSQPEREERKRVRYHEPGQYGVHIAKPKRTLITTSTSTTTSTLYHVEMVTSTLPSTTSTSTTTLPSLTPTSLPTTSTTLPQQKTLTSLTKPLGRVVSPPPERRKMPVGIVTLVSIVILILLTIIFYLKKPASRRKRRTKLERV